jgi:hypothetical protein
MAAAMHRHLPKHPGRIVAQPLLKEVLYWET